MDVRPSAVELRAMLVMYARDRDRSCRDSLLDAYAYLAAACARRFVGRGEDFEDLRQVALMALVQALDRYDPARGTEFVSYAGPTITGALKRHLRDRSWLVRPPRRIQERYLCVARLADELAGELGRSPDVSDIAAHCSWNEDEVREALAAGGLRRPRVAPLDDVERADVPRQSDELVQAEHRWQLHTLLAELSPLERRIIQMRFGEDLTQLAIARRVGVSQMHVSRTLTRVLARLRARAAQQLAS
jgi:RNA polymerase sigma-B factor